MEPCLELLAHHVRAVVAEEVEEVVEEAAVRDHADARLGVVEEPFQEHSGSRQDFALRLTILNRFGFAGFLGFFRVVGVVD